MKLLDVLTAPWAIRPDKYREIVAIYETHLRGDKIDIEGVEARLGHRLNNEPKPYEVINGAAVLPMHGVIARRMNLFTRISGGVSTELLGRDFKAALADGSVEQIILDVDSPGGAVDGTAELAEIIYNARGEKPITAVASGMMASAAYWIGSAADQVFITGTTTMVGSIGVVATHVDQSRAEEKMGFKVSEITAGRHKRMVSRHEPLSREGREAMQADVDYIYGLFLEAVGKHRGVGDLDRVHEEMADARDFIGLQAVEAGLVDGVSTIEAVIGEQDGNQTITVQGKAYSPEAAEELVTTLNESHSGGVPLEIKEDEMDNDKKTVAVDDISADYLKEHCPMVFDAIKAKGYEAGLADGGERERDRIKEVRDAGLPGHEALVEKLMFDGKTTGGEAATQVIAAEKGKLGSNLDRLKKDAPKGVDPSDESEHGTGVDPNMPVEERCKAEWEKDPKIRAEFTSREAYIAFKRAEENGQARVFKK